MRLVLDSYNLQAAKRLLIVTALETFESLEEVAESLGITVRALERDMDFARINRPAGPTTKKAPTKKAPAKKASAKKAAKTAPAKKKATTGGRHAR